LSLHGGRRVSSPLAIRRTTLALAASFMVIAAHVEAQRADFQGGRGLDPRLVRPASDRYGFIGVDGAGVAERGEFGMVMSIADAVSSLRVGRSAVGASSSDRPLVDHAVSAALSLHTGLLERGPAGASIGVIVPVHVLEGEDHVIEGSYNARRGPLRSQGLGAPAAVLKWAPRSSRHAPWGVALVAQLDLNVGGALRSDPGPTLWPRVVLEWLPMPLELALNAGYRWVSARGPVLGDRLRYDDQATASVAVRSRVFGPLEAGAEWHGAQLVRSLGEPRALSSELLMAVGLRMADARIRVAAGFGTGDGFLEADARVMLLLAVNVAAPDRDGDRIVGDAEHCPGAPEDFDLRDDTDGCPELDNDRDGVPDAHDFCADDHGRGEPSGCPVRRSGL